MAQLTNLRRSESSGKHPRTACHVQEVSKQDPVSPTNLFLGSNQKVKWSSNDRVVNGKAGSSNGLVVEGNQQETVDPSWFLHQSPLVKRGSFP